MNLSVLPKAQQNLWKNFSKTTLLEPFYLAGGTAIALNLAHRESIDFDFFTEKAFKMDELIDELSKIGKVTISHQNERTFVGFLSQVQVSFFHYPYPLVAPMKILSGIHVADLKDIVAMKIIAISQRGAKKDFVDLHALLNAGWNFEEVFQCVDRKYENQQHNKMHLLKSLIYFEEAEEDPMPKMLRPVSWAQIKTDLQTAVREFSFGR